MKLCSYVHRGEASYGVVTDSGIVDLGDRLGTAYPTLVQLLRHNGLGAARDASSGLEPDIQPEGREFLP